MINFVKGSIFDSKAQGIINTVNCAGIMGKGLALQFKQRFPMMFRDYVRVCSLGQLRPGKLHTFEEKEKLIINFPTKDTWRRKSKMSYIEDGLDALVAFIKETGIKSVAIPPLGAGNGGLDWDDVKKVILDKIQDVVNDIDVFVYEPSVVKPKGVQSRPVLTTKGYYVLEIVKFVGYDDVQKIKDTGYFVNQSLKKKYYYLERIGRVPKEGTIEDIFKEVLRYIDYCEKEKKDVMKSVMKDQVGNKDFTKNLLNILPCVQKSGALIGFLGNNHKAACAIDIYETLKKKRKVSMPEEELYTIFQDKYTEDEFKEVVERLCQTDFIEKSLFGLQVKKGIASNFM